MKRECLHPEEIETEVVPSLTMSWADRIDFTCLVLMLTIIVGGVLVMSYALAYDIGNRAGYAEGRSFEQANYDNCGNLK